MFDAAIYTNLRDNAPAMVLAAPARAQRGVAKTNALSLAERRCMP